MVYLDAFATVVKPLSYKSFFAVEVKRELKIWHIEFVTGFFYGFLGKVFCLSNSSCFIWKTKNIRYFYFKKPFTVSNNFSLSGIRLFLNSCKQWASKVQNLIEMFSSQKTCSLPYNWMIFWLLASLIGTSKIFIKS